MDKRKTIMRAMAKTRRAWNAHVKQITLAEGIPDSYRPVIMFLNRNYGAGQRDIAEFEGVTTSAVNQVVKNMLEEGYIRKETDSSDKRNSKLYLTEKGAAVADGLRRRLDTSDDAITTFIGEEKEKELIDILEMLAEYIRKDLNQC